MPLFKQGKLTGHLRPTIHSWLSTSSEITTLPSKSTTSHLITSQSFFSKFYPFFSSFCPWYSPILSLIKWSCILLHRESRCYQTRNSHNRTHRSSCKGTHASSFTLTKVQIFLHLIFGSHCHLLFSESFTIIYPFTFTIHNHSPINLSLLLSICPSSAPEPSFRTAIFLLSFIVDFSGRVVFTYCCYFFTFYILHNSLWSGSDAIILLK